MNIADLVLVEMQRAERNNRLSGPQRKQLVLDILKDTLRDKNIPLELVSEFIDVIVAVDKHKKVIHRALNGCFNC